MDETLVFITKDKPGAIGDGYHYMLACFLSLGAHVLFATEHHSENIYLKEVSDPTPCDGSCQKRSGHIECWTDETAEYPLILKKAKEFSKQNT